MTPSQSSTESRISTGSSHGGSVCHHSSSDGSRGGDASHEPAKADGLNELESAIETVGASAERFGKGPQRGTVSPRLKMAAFIQPLQADIQDIVFQTTGTCRRVSGGV